MTQAVAQHDVIVIGGGPGGSCAATFLAKAGKKVLVLEKEHFPRFHIGESLLPYNHALFEELGLLPALENAGFPMKKGAQFHLGNGSKGVGFAFKNGRFTRHTAAFQVERSKFDQILLTHARTCGAEVSEGVSVERIESDAEGVSVLAASSEGKRTYRARLLIDASGRGNVTGTQEAIREPNLKLRKLAIFGHFEGVSLDAGESAGDTVIVRLNTKWFWLIPLRIGAGGNSKVSVGLVMDRDEFSQSGRSAEEVFEQLVASSPPVAARLRQARKVSPIQVTSDFSYRNRSFWSSRVIRVGDAAGFIDPIFSSGVYIAMYSAKLAASAVIEELKFGGNGSSRFPAYERRLQSAMAIYMEMVENFYTTPFMEVFLEPRAKWNLDAAVNAVLAGELEGGWKLRWRMRVFFWLVRLQSKRPFMPRVSFDSMGAKPS